MTELEGLYGLQIELEDSLKEVKKEIEKRQVFTERMLSKYGFKLNPITDYRYKSFIKNIGKTRVELIFDIVNPNDITIIKGDNFTESGLEFEVQCEADLAKLLVQAKVL